MYKKTFFIKENSCERKITVYPGPNMLIGPVCVPGFDGIKRLLD